MRRQDEADRIAAQEREYQRGRRATLDQREDTGYAQAQMDRERGLAEHAEDRGYLTAVERPRADRRAAQADRIADFKEGRLPIEAKQEDAKFSWQMNREKRAAHMDGIRAQLEQYGLDEARLKQEVRAATRALNPAIAAYSRTRDPRVFAEWANNTVARDNPISIEQGRDGNWYMQSGDGDPQNLGSADNVMQVARTLTHPEVFMEFQASQLKRAQEVADKQAANEQRFTELVNDEDGRLYMVDTRTGVSRPITRQGGGEVMRGTLAGRFGSREGDRAIPGLRNRRPDLRPEDVMDGGNGMPRAGGLLMRSSQGAAPARPAAPQQRQAPAVQRTIVKTGKAPDGRRVAQYSDGSIEYIQ